MLFVILQILNHIVFFSLLLQNAFDDLVSHWSCSKPTNDEHKSSAWLRNGKLIAYSVQESWCSKYSEVPQCCTFSWFTQNIKNSYQNKGGNILQVVQMVSTKKIQFFSLFFKILIKLILLNNCSEADPGFPMKGHWPWKRLISNLMFVFTFALSRHSHHWILPPSSPFWNPGKLYLLDLHTPDKNVLYFVK